MASARRAALTARSTAYSPTATRRSRMPVMRSRSRRGRRRQERSSSSMRERLLGQVDAETLDLDLVGHQAVLRRQRGHAIGKRDRRGAVAELAPRLADIVAAVAGDEPRAVAGQRRRSPAPARTRGRLEPTSRRRRPPRTARSIAAAATRYASAIASSASPQRYLLAVGDMVDLAGRRGALGRQRRSRATRLSTCDRPSRLRPPST